MYPRTDSYTTIFAPLLGVRVRRGSVVPTGEIITKHQNTNRGESGLNRLPCSTGPTIENYVRALPRPLCHTSHNQNIVPGRWLFVPAAWYLTSKCPHNYQLLEYYRPLVSLSTHVVSDHELEYTSLPMETC